MNTDITPTETNPLVDAVTEEMADAPEADATEEVLEELSDDDLLPSRPRIELVPITLPSGKRKNIAIIRLTGDEAIDAINDAGEATEGKRKTKDKVKDVIHLKVKRCVAKSGTDETPRFTDAALIKFRKECDSDLLSAIMSAIHAVNPVLKQAG